VEKKLRFIIYLRAVAFYVKKLLKNKIEDYFLRKIEDILKKKKLKITPTRLAIIHLMSQKHRLFTVDELVRELFLKNKKKYDWVTVYRNLQTFYKSGLIDETDFGDGLSRYEWNHGDDHHHHVVCKKCKKIKILPHCNLSEFEKNVFKLGFTNIHHRLEFFGTCKDCQ